MLQKLKLAAILIAYGALVGCTVNREQAPAFTGPSVFGTNLVVTANPDTLVLNGQQSLVLIEASDAKGAPLPNLRVHLDATAGNAPSACGRLSLSDVTTGSDGRSAVLFIAPTLPLPLPECANVGSGATIVASPVGTNAQTTNFFSTAIRFLMPSSGPSSPAVFTVNFLISPNPGTVGAPIAFADAGSVSPGHSIVSYRWTWSDGAAKNGASVTHDFGSAGLYTATLTITDDIGQAGSKSALILVN